MTRLESDARRTGGDLSFARPSADPGGIVPAQCDARRPATPELRLMAAVLAQAIHDHGVAARSSASAGQRLRRKSDAWFAAEEREWPYSFERICAALDLDADAIRERLARSGASRRASHGHLTGPRRKTVAPAAQASLERRVA